MKKRIITTILLCLAMACLTACGQDSSEDTASGQEMVALDEKDKGEKPTASENTLPKEEDSSEQTQEKSDQALAIDFSYQTERKDFSVKNEQGEVCADMYYDLLQFEDEKLFSANQMLRDEEASFEEAAEGYKTDCVEPDMEAGWLTSESPYYYNSELTNVFHNEKYLSVQNIWMHCMGGVSSYGYGITNYDYVNQKVPTLSEVTGIAEDELVLDAISAVHVFCESNEVMEDYVFQGSLADSYEMSDFHFFLQEDGVYLHFEKYEILAGAAGCIDIFFYSWKDGLQLSEDQKIGADGILADGAGNTLTDGKYFTSLLGAEMAESYEEMGIAYTLDAKIEDGRLCVDGDFSNYENDYHSDKLYYEMAIASDATFSIAGGEAAPEYMEMEEFASYLERVAESGLGLEIEIKDGEVVSACISS